MNDGFKPMLAAKFPEGVTVEDLRYPVLASPKLDGIRAIVRDGVVLSRTLKPIPNLHVQKLYGKEQYERLDGELIVGPPTAEDCFRRTTSGVMSVEGEPAVRFHVFDVVPLKLGSKSWQFNPFYDRLVAVTRRKIDRAHAEVVPHTHLASHEALAAFEASVVGQGYEGVMLRDMEGPYKMGRSTFKEGWLLKVKRFEDSEAEVLEAVEELANTNEAKKDELGRTKRSLAKAGRIGTDRLGALKVQDLSSGVKFDVGTGFSDAERENLWAMKERLAGRIVKYRFFPVGVKEKPRHPVFVGFRDERDL